MHRVVLDTNVIVSALIGDRRGPSSTIWKRMLRGQDELACSAAIAAEVEEVLRELGVEKAMRDGFLARLKKTAIMVKPKHEKNYVPQDPDDDKIIEAALAAKADYIVSGDKKHILPLKEIEGIKILSPAEYLRQL